MQRHYSYQTPAAQTQVPAAIGGGVTVQRSAIVASMFPICVNETAQRQVVVNGVLLTELEAEEGEPPVDLLAFRTGDGTVLRGVCAYRPGGNPDHQGDNVNFNLTPYDVNGNVSTQLPTARRQYILASGFNHVRASYSVIPIISALEHSDAENIASFGVNQQTRVDTLIDKILDDVELYVADGLMVVIDNHISNFGQYPIPNYSCRDLTDGVAGAKFLALTDALVQLATELHVRSATLPPDMVSLELFNEPPDAVNIPGDAWEVQQAALFASVRAVLPDHTIVVTGRQFARIETLIDLDSADYDANTIYTFHPYDPFLISHYNLAGTPDSTITFPPGDATQKATVLAANGGFASEINDYYDTPQDETWMDSELATITSWRIANGINANQVWAGELGCLDYKSDTVREAFDTAWVERIEAAGFGWNLYALNTTGQDQSDATDPWAFHTRVFSLPGINPP